MGSNKKKSCVEAGLVDKNDDSSEAKDGLRNLLEEDSDEVFEFLDSYSSRTFNDIDNEDSPNEETKPGTGSESTSSSSENKPTTETNTDTESRQNENNGRDFLQKLKTKLKKAVVWMNENKDKTLDEILVKGWKEKCSKSNLQCRSKGPKRRKMSKQAKTSSSNCRKSQSEKKKRCVEAGLVDKNDDSS